jgi:hypothetical protein
MCSLAAFQIPLSTVECGCAHFSVHILVSYWLNVLLFPEFSSGLRLVQRCPDSNGSGRNPQC